MPSVRELSDHLGRAPSTIHQHLRALENRGYLQRDGKAHGLKLLVEDRQLGLGEICGGTLLPIKGQLNPGRRLRRSRPPYERLAVGGDTRPGDYVLRVDGGRLEEDGIFDGDLLVIRPGGAGNQPALVAHLDGTADLKRVVPVRNGMVALAPARPRWDRGRAPQIAGDVVVQGRLLQVIRRFDLD